MKRIILVLVVILISTNTLHATKFNWTDGMKDKDGMTEFYIDKKSLIYIKFTILSKKIDI